MEDEEIALRGKTIAWAGVVAAPQGGDAEFVLHFTDNKRDRGYMAARRRLVHLKHRKKSQLLASQIQRTMFRGHTIWRSARQTCLAYLPSPRF